MLAVINELHSGGAERMVVDQILATKDVDFAACIFGPETPLSDALESGRVPLFALRATLRVDPRQMFHVLGAARTFRPDIIHAHLPRAGAFAGMAGRLLRRPVIYTEHNVRDAYSRATSTLADTATGLAELVTAVSDEVRRSTLAATAKDPTRVVTIRNGVNVPPATDRGRTDQSRLRLCCIANLFPRKGYQHLLPALATAITQGAEVTLDVFGSGPSRDALLRTTHELGLDDRVTFHGHTPDAAKHLPAFDAFVLASLAEGLPIALLEAMAAGLPVIATAVGGVPEVIQDDVSGILVRAGDPAALSGPIVRLARDENLRRRLGVAGRERVEAEFTVARMADAYRSRYEALVHARAVGRL